MEEKEKPGPSQITIAARRGAEAVQRNALLWKCVSHPGRCRASDACGVVGAESQGVFGSGTAFSSEDVEKVYGTLPQERLSAL
ncbi:hypothetical protein DPEC_G00254420 [Dallia pectoralis]|uniref:Uncharacterized protein n=1 Tax=Dallia pectoralis TaxID=75939 RepID=A0ACC2FU84_DALPE|nr:hypothetical protein DPEC_G00254420 [Dallia pectoralis]